MLLVWIIVTLFIVASLAATIVLYAAVAASARASAELDRPTIPARRTPSNHSVRATHQLPPPTRPTGEWAQPQ